MAIVTDIVAELQRGGPLRNPFERLYPVTAPADYVAGEVQRAIDRIRVRRDYKRPPNIPNASASDYRKLGRLLRKTGRADHAEQIGASDHVRQEPPPRGNPLKHYCADEAFCLVEWFSFKPATFSADGAYQVTAQLLYQAVTGKKDADMERACDWILKERRKVRQHGTDA